MASVGRVMFDPAHVLSVLSNRNIDPTARIDFESLGLQRLSKNEISFNYDVFLQGWIACSLPSEFLYAGDKTEILAFLARWYGEYVRNGGEPRAELDVLFDDLLSAHVANKLRIVSGRAYA